MEEFFTVYQVAVALKVHVITIRRYIREGKLKAVRVGGNIRIAGSELKHFTQNFVPRNKNNKEFPKTIHGNFSFNDPLFRLKGRGLGIDISSRKEDQG
jgi:excisionase family DNA binding protein